VFYDELGETGFCSRKETKWCTLSVVWNLSIESRKRITFLVLRNLLVAVAATWSGTNLIAQEVAHEFSAAEKNALVAKVVGAHRHWKQRLTEISGSVEIELRDMRSGTTAIKQGLFWQKGESFRQDIIDVRDGSKAVEIWAPDQHVFVAFVNEVPQVHIGAPPACNEEAQSLRNAANAALMGYCWPLMSYFSDGKLRPATGPKMEAGAALRILPVELELTEQGAKEAGFPSIPPRGWFYWKVWLDVEKDYAVVKTERTTFGMGVPRVDSYLSVEFVSDAAGGWKPKRVQNGWKGSGGSLFPAEGKEREFRFLSYSYGPVKDEIFDWKKLDLPSGIIVDDEIAGRQYEFEPPRK
jgi:hypothetical protein